MIDFSCIQLCCCVFLIMERIPRIVSHMTEQNIGKFAHFVVWHTIAVNAKITQILRIVSVNEFVAYNYFICTTTGDNICLFFSFFINDVDHWYMHVNANYIPKRRDTHTNKFPIFSTKLSPSMLYSHIYEMPCLRVSFFGSTHND